MFGVSFITNNKGREAATKFWKVVHVVAANIVALEWGSSKIPFAKTDRHN